MIFFNLFILLLGLSIGSFLNVCIYRIPQNRTVVTTPSHCPLCKHPIQWYDLIPLVSYILLKGKCRNCKGAISLRYPFVELLNAVSYLLIFFRFGFTLQTAGLAVLTSALIAAAMIDLEHQLIPDKINLFILAAGLVYMPFHPGLPIWEALVGLVVASLPLLLLAILTKGGMGGGDIKLMAAAGLFLGWKLILLALFAASLLGSTAGIGMILLKRKKRKDPIPFGPYLAAGIFLCGLYGNDFLYWYLNLLY